MKKAKVIIKLTIILGLVGHLAACKLLSFGDDEDEESTAKAVVEPKKKLPKKKSKAKQKQKIDQLYKTLHFNRQESQEIYIKMLKQELDNGIKVPKKQLHTSEALVQCHKDDVQLNCNLLVRLGHNKLSTKQQVRKSISGRILEFIETQRPKLATAEHVFGDLHCNFLGKKSPPYVTQTVDCQFVAPRAPTETILAGRTAEVLSETLRGEERFKEKQWALRGRITCHVVPSSFRRHCIVRPQRDGVITSDIIELDSDDSAHVGRRILQSYSDYLHVRNKSMKQDPEFLEGALHCVVDFKSKERSQIHTCKIDISN